jgi:hypothetical protein
LESGWIPIRTKEHAMEHDQNLIALVAIFLMAGTPLLITAQVLHFRLRARQATDNLIYRLIEKEQPVPPDLLAGHADPFADLRWGMVLVALGLGILVAGYVLPDDSVRAGAFIPLFMGGGFLVTFAIQRTTKALASRDIRDTN